MSNKNVDSPLSANVISEQQKSHTEKSEKSGECRCSKTTATESHHWTFAETVIILVLTIVAFIAFTVGYTMRSSNKSQSSKSTPRITLEETDKRYATIPQIKQIYDIFRALYMGLDNMSSNVNTRLNTLDRNGGEMYRMFLMMNDRLNAQEASISNLTQKVRTR